MLSRFKNNQDKAVLRKIELKSLIKETEKKTFPIMGEIDNLLHKLDREAANIKGLESRIERDANRTIGENPEDLRELQRANANYGDMEATYNNKEKELKSLNSKIEASKSELGNINIKASDSALLAHKKAIEAELDQIEKYQDLIDKNKIIIEGDTDTQDSTQDLKQQREALLVGIALGENKEAELNAIDKKISALLEKDKAVNSKREVNRTNAQQTIAGLTKKQEVHEAKLDTLNSITPELMTDYLQSLADEAAERYKQASELLCDSLLDICSFNELIGKHGIKKHTELFNNNYWKIIIPRLKNINNIRVDTNGTKTEIANNELTSFITKENTDKIKQQLIKKGIYL